ncbi:MAG: hypothetical protein ACRBBW_14055 [Cellvibrionaceae bacterium]
MAYRINFDTQRYLGVFIDEDELDEKVGDLLYPDGVSIAEQWEEAPEAVLYDATGKERDDLVKPDIASWVGNLALGPKAYDLLVESLSPLGEFLPITIGDTTWQVFNLTHTLSNQVVDESKSEQVMSGAIYMGLKSLVFRAEALSDELFFRCKYDQGVGQFATEDFRELVTKHKLTGLVFSEDLVK